MTVQLSSKVLPASLVATLRKKSEAMVKKLVYGPPGQKNEDESKKKGQGKPQAYAVFEFIRNIMESNNLIPAWDEIPEIKEVLRLKPAG